MKVCGEHRSPDKCDFSEENFYAAVLEFINLTMNENPMNSTAEKQSIFTCVSWHHDAKKWQVQISSKPGGKQKRRGLFTSELKAWKRVCEIRNAFASDKPQFRSILAFYNDEGKWEPHAITFKSWKEMVYYCRPEWKTESRLLRRKRKRSKTVSGDE
jgi:hypothetical protein